MRERHRAHLHHSALRSFSARPNNGGLVFAGNRKLPGDHIRQEVPRRAAAWLSQSRTTWVGTLQPNDEETAFFSRVCFQPEPSLECLCPLSAYARIASVSRIHFSCVFRHCPVAGSWHCTALHCGAKLYLRTVFYGILAVPHTVPVRILRFGVGCATRERCSVHNLFHDYTRDDLNMRNHAPCCR